MTVKMICIDIDGTLLNDKHEVTPAVKQTIQKAKAAGIKVVITTGRPLQGVYALLEELNLMDQGDYVITYNGGVVKEMGSGEEILRTGLDNDDFLEIETLSRKLHVHLHFFTDERLYTTNADISPYTVLESYLVKVPLSFRRPEEITEELSIIKMMYIDDPQLIDTIIPQIPQAFLDKYTCVRSSPYFFEIMNKRVSKGTALLNLAEKLGIQQEETMAIGDADNDLAMLEAAGLSVAMGNATETVKRVSDVTTTSNNENGVAVAIEKYAL